MKSQLLKIWTRSSGRTVVGALLGALAGALYGQYVGCLTGSCPLTSNPWTAGALGALLGASLVAPERPSKDESSVKAS